MKKISFLLTFYIACIFLLVKNVSAAEYPSIDNLSEEEKEFLPYYDFGWTYCNRYSNRDFDIYYLGQKVKTVKAKLDFNGTAYYDMLNSSHVVTNEHQLFMVMHDNQYLNCDYIIVRYNLDTDEYREINNQKYIESVYGSIKRIITNGEDIYILCKGNSSKLNILKYDSSEDSFVYKFTFSDISVDKLLLDNLVYDVENKVWKTEINQSGGRYPLVTMDLEKGTFGIDEEDLGQGLTAGTKFSMFQRKTGIIYYWKRISIENEYTGAVTYYEQLRKIDAGEDYFLLQVPEYRQAELQFISPNGISVRYNTDTRLYLIYNEKNQTSKWSTDIIEKDLLGIHAIDMWNYYVDNVAYPIWEPAATEIEETKTQVFADRITISWKTVNNAQGYNIYVNDQKVNTSIITDNTYTIKGLKKDTNYNINITAVNNVGESEKSAVVSIKTGSILIGDINQDGKINIIDAMRVFHYVSGRNKSIDINLADINADGKVNIVDAMKVFHYVSGRNKEI